MEHVIENIEDMKHELSSSIRVWNHKKENAADCFQRYVEETGYANAIAWYSKDVIQSEIVCEKLVEFQETIAGIDQFMEPNKDGSAAHMGFKLDGGGLLGQSDTKGRMVYIKNICFSYKNK